MENKPIYYTYLSIEFGKNPFLELFVKHKFWNWVKCFWMCLNLDINKSVSLSIFFCKDSAFFWRKEGKFIPKVDSTKNRPVFGLPTELWKLRCLKWNTSIKTLSSYNIFHALDATLCSRFCCSVKYIELFLVCILFRCM